MIQTAREVALPPVPDEVSGFADEHGARAWLINVLAMTRRIFPDPELRVQLESDPEIANDRHIAFEIEVTGMTVSQMVSCQNQWSTELFQECPATHAHLFRLAMV